MKYFQVTELDCPCCGECKMDPNLTEKLDLLRERFGKPLYVNSAYRCHKHNYEVGGKITSHHLAGRAVDISTARMTREDKYKFLKLAMDGFHGIGIGKTYIHVDIGQVKAMWVY